MSPRLLLALAVAALGVALLTLRALAPTPPPPPPAPTDVAGLPRIEPADDPARDHALALMAALPSLGDALERCQAPDPVAWGCAVAEHPALERAARYLATHPEDAFRPELQPALVEVDRSFQALGLAGPFEFLPPAAPPLEAQPVPQSVRRVLAYFGVPTPPPPTGWSAIGYQAFADLQAHCDRALDHVEDAAPASELGMAVGLAETFTPGEALRSGEAYLLLRATRREDRILNNEVMAAAHRALRRTVFAFGQVLATTGDHDAAIAALLDEVKVHHWASILGGASCEAGKLAPTPPPTRPLEWMLEGMRGHASWTTARFMAGRRLPRPPALVSAFRVAAQPGGPDERLRLGVAHTQQLHALRMSGDTAGVVDLYRNGLLHLDRYHHRHSRRIVALVGQWVSTHLEASKMPEAEVRQLAAKVRQYASGHSRDGVTSQEIVAARLEELLRRR